MAEKCEFVLEPKAVEFTELIQSMTGKHQLWELWADFIVLTAISCSQQLDFRKEREERYLATAGKYGSEEMENFSRLFALVMDGYEQNREQDMLGSIYMKLNLGSHWTGQFFTPYGVCQNMSGISTAEAVKQIQKKGYVTMLDSASGAGAILIATANSIQRSLAAGGSHLNLQDHVLAVAQDLSENTALICYIQLSLLGIAAIVYIGDSLEEPYRFDPLCTPPADNIWFTPMYFSNVWNWRRKVRMITRITNAGRNNNGRKVL
jgi:type I restriction-modification system DNA methylase subunit|nr:MAG TPA: type I restriction-modification system methyltransferase [Caudoviricetes sp.]